MSKNIIVKKYSQGKFSDYTLEIKETNPDATFMETLGYDLMIAFSVGETFTTNYEAIQHKSDGSYLFTVSITGEDEMLVYAPTILDALLFMKEFAPVFEMSAIRNQLSELEYLFKKFMEKD